MSQSQRQNPRKLNVAFAPGLQAAIPVEVPSEALSRPIRAVITEAIENETSTSAAATRSLLNSRAPLAFEFEGRFHRGNASLGDVLGRAGRGGTQDTGTAEEALVDQIQGTVRIMASQKGG